MHTSVCMRPSSRRLGCLTPVSVKHMNVIDMISIATSDAVDCCMARPRRDHTSPSSERGKAQRVSVSIKGFKVAAFKGKRECTSVK